MNTLARARRAVWGIRHEWRWGWHHVTSGRGTYLVNVIVYRLLALFKDFPGAESVCQLVTDQGTVLWYRRNRGDIQGIREIFIDEIYRLPEGATPPALLDLGANIGLATVWLCREYDIRTFVAFEPLPANHALLERNCRANGLAGALHNVAVGPASGTATFDVGRESNLGRIGEGELTVPVWGIAEVAADPFLSGAILKIDVEGMERELFATDGGQWTSSMSMIAIEMHPQYFDIEPLIEQIQALGFRYFPPVEVSEGHARSKRERLFVREPCSLHR